jgi:hypothetical protein
MLLACHCFTGCWIFGGIRQICSVCVLIYAWYLPRQIPRYTESPRTNTPAVAKKLKKLGIGKKKIPLLSTNQKTTFIYKVESEGIKVKSSCKYSGSGKNERN